MTNAYGNLKLVAGQTKVERAEWSERLEIGIPLIDDQHKRFFDLAASLSSDRDQVGVMKTLFLLNDHVRNHFRDEEALMAACNYPGTEVHRQSHQEFRAMLADLLDRARQMTLDEIAEAVKHLVNEWIARHIVTADFEYAPHVRMAKLPGLAGLSPS